MAEALKLSGNQALAEKRFDDAIRDYTAAIALNPREHIYYSNRSAAFLYKNFAEAALEDAIKCIELRPDYAKGHGRAAAAHHKLFRYSNAEKAYKRGLELCPGDAALTQGLAALQPLLNSPFSMGTPVMMDGEAMERLVGNGASVTQHDLDDYRRRFGERNPTQQHAIDFGMLQMKIENRPESHRRRHGRIQFFDPRHEEVCQAQGPGTPARGTGC